MGVAFFIVLERKIDGLDTTVDGKGLGRSMEALDQAATELGVTQLTDFFGADPEMVAEYCRLENEDVSRLTLPPLGYFSAGDGLVSIRALLKHPVAQDEGIARDLKECERVLEAASQHGVGWHFELDF
jgi:hypothetical protein